MSSKQEPSHSPPTNLITQVTRPDDDSSLITNGLGSNTNETQITIEKRDKRIAPEFIRSICCCFWKKNDYREDGTISEPQIEGFLLPTPTPDILGKKTLVLDLDETLVHSSFKPIPNPDFIIPVEIEDQVHKVYVVKRPGVDKFLEKLGAIYETVVFTASLAKYADPVLDLLDTHKVVKARLFREACSNYKGNYVKDLNRLGREIKNTIIIDNSPTSYLFHPENAIAVESWFDDEHDTELFDLVPILETITRADNVRPYLEALKKPNGKFVLTKSPL